MSGARPNIFDDIDLSGFAPRSEGEAPPSLKTVRKVSEEGGFPSRAPPPLRRLAAAKTGRTVLLNARITPRAHDRFHDIVEAERLRYEAENSPTGSRLARSSSALWRRSSAR
jgi:hypothetical protein